MMISVLFLSSHPLRLTTKCLKSLAVAIRNTPHLKIELLIGFQEKSRETEIKSLVSELGFENHSLNWIDASLPAPQARNLMLRSRNSNADWILFLDDDVEVHEKFFTEFERLVKAYPEAKVFGGPNLNPPEQKGLGADAGQLLGSPLNFLCRQRYQRGSEGPRFEDRDFILCNLFVRTGLHPNFSDALPFGEEIGLIRQFIKSGQTCVYSPELFVFHYRRETLDQVLKQIERYGFGRGLAEKESAQRLNLRVLGLLFFLAVIAWFVNPVLQIFWHRLPWEASKSSWLHRIFLILFIPWFYRRGLRRGLGLEDEGLLEQHAGQFKISFWLAGLGVFLLGTALRLYHLGTQSLDLDEMITVGLSRSESWRSLLDDTNPPLYLFFNRFWLTHLPSDEFWIRFPAFAFSTSALALLIFLGLMSSPQNLPLALAPALLFALAPGSVSVAQWARGNSLWELATVMGMSGFLRRGPLRMLGGWLLAMGTQWFAFLPSTAIFLGRLLNRQGTRRRLLAICALTAIFVLAANFALNFVSFHLDWQVMRFQRIPFFLDVIDQLNQLFGQWWPPVIGLILTAGTLLKILRAESTREQREEAWLILVGLLFAISLVALSLMQQRSLFLARYLTPIVPIFCWALTRQILVSSRARLLRYLLLTAWIAGSLWGLTAYYQRPAPVWREALRVVRQTNPITLWTTRSVAIVHPYLDNTTIQVRPFYGHEADLPALLESATEGPIAFIDNFWGGLLYWESLKEQFKSKGFQVVEYGFKSDPLEPNEVQVIIVRKAAP